MTLVADFLVAAGGLCAALYCHLLSLRLKRLTALESGMGNAIAVLSAQVDDMTLALDQAKTTSETSTKSLEEQVALAQATATRIELLLASLHDLPAERNQDSDAERRLRLVRRRGERTGLKVAE
jgi:hypothetical protein